MKNIIVAGALGECVHVAGVSKFLRLAQMTGWKTVFLGPAVPLETFLEAVKREEAQLVGVSYRLTPETGERLLAQFAEAADELRSKGVRFLFAGTPPLAKKAQQMGFFERAFEGGEPEDELLSFLRGESTVENGETAYPQTAVERIQWKSPYPILRHHFGLPTMEATEAGVRDR